MLKDDCNKYKIFISEQTNDENTDLEVNNLFDDKRLALDLITLLCENSVPLEQSNEIVHNLIK